MNEKIMISYAQNGEDVILRRAFGEKTGFYVDVGAAYPTLHSVTKHFYDAGWSGVNIEPQPDLFVFLQAARTRDSNINCAASATAEKVTLTVFDDAWGWATSEPEIAETHTAGGRHGRSIEVEARSVDQILQEQEVEEIDFMKIDVEGAEADVIRSANLKRWHPKVIVVEATIPNSTEQAYAEWEGEILASGYRFAFFDGLNRYYVHEHHQELADKIAVPPNVFDSFVPFEWWHLIDPVKQAAWVERQKTIGKDLAEFAIYAAQRASIDEEMQHALKRM